MKGKKNDISIRELFRRKLENEEIIPDPSLNAKVMRKLAIKEFQHFNPSSFNIYYLSTIVVAAFTAGIILFSGNKGDGNHNLENISGEKLRSDSTVYLNIPVTQPVVIELDKPNTEKRIASKEKSPGSQILTDDNEEVRVKGTSEESKTFSNDLIDSFSKKGIMTEKSTDINKLQKGIKNDDVRFEQSVSEGCIPLKIHFNLTSDSFDSCKWTFGDGGISYENNPEWIYDMEGEYRVVLNLYGSDNKHTVSTTTVSVHPKPVAHFEISPEKAVIPEDVIHFYNYSTNAVKFRWDFGDGTTSSLFEPVHFYKKYGKYNVRLYVTSDYGCSDSLIVMNAFAGSEYYIEFPNAFIPNTQGPSGGYYSTKSDEGAQVFHPASLGVAEYQFRIFSKRGILMFESNDISIGWDGYFKSQLADPGVYIWKVRGKFRNGEPFIKMGDVTILRN